MLEKEDKMKTITVTKNIPDIINVLDHGFVELIDYMGSDKHILQAARVSTGGVGSKGDKEDRGLIRYLYRNKHGTPFEQNCFTFHTKMPIFVARQFMRHRIGFSFNEYSARYSEVVDDFYLPETFRVQGKKNHQGSGDDINDINDELNRLLLIQYEEEMNLSFDAYKWAISENVAREQARIVIPVSSYTEIYFTTNLRALFNMLTLRLHSHSQQEIKDFSEAILTILKSLPEFKWSMEIFEEDIKIDWKIQELKNFFKDQYTELENKLESIMH